MSISIQIANRRDTGLEGLSTGPHRGRQRSQGGEFNRLLSLVRGSSRASTPPTTIPLRIGTEAVNRETGSPTDSSRAGIPTGVSRQLASSQASPSPELTAEAPVDRFMLPMQASWNAPALSETWVASPYPVDPVSGLPTVSQETLNRYIHPLQAIGIVSADGAVPAIEQAGIATTVYRVSPSGGMQDLVTSDGFRHRFDVEVVYPSASSRSWQGRDALSIHPEVAEFAVAQLTENLEKAGIDSNQVDVSTFRMHGGTPATPWFLDELIVQAPDGRELMVSLNVSLRDPQCAVEAIAEFLDAIPS